MPIPQPRDGESQDDFMGRCMGDSVMNEEYPDGEQRAAVCMTQWEGRDKEKPMKPKSEEINFDAVRRETKTFRFEVKELQETGVFEGFASVFGNEDLGGDVVEAGAFAKTIKERKGRVPLLRNHKEAVGITYIAETDHGLQVKGYINLKKQGGRDTYEDLKFYQEHGMPMGMSFGYDVVRKKDDDAGRRHLIELKCWETTLTEFPMNPEAAVTNVKERKVMEDGKMPDFDTVLEQTQMEAARYQMMYALSDTLTMIFYASNREMAVAEKVKATETAVDQFKAAYLEMLPKCLEMHGEKELTPAEIKAIKAGARLSAATRKQIQTCIDSLMALMEEEADSTSDKADDTSAKAEAVITEAKAAATSVPEPPKEEETPPKAKKAVEFLTSLTEDLKAAFK